MTSHGQRWTKLVLSLPLAKYVDNEQVKQTVSKGTYFTLFPHRFLSCSSEKTGWTPNPVSHAKAGINPQFINDFIKSWTKIAEHAGKLRWWTFFRNRIRAKNPVKYHESVIPLPSSLLLRLLWTSNWVSLGVNAFLTLQHSNMGSLCPNLLYSKIFLKLLRLKIKDKLVTRTFSRVSGGLLKFLTHFY